MANINTGMVETHDETKPAGTRARSLGDDDIREFKRVLRERLAYDHQFYQDETGYTNVGTHKKVTLSEAQVADPTAYDDVGYLYLKEVSGVLELFWEDDQGNITQITSAGYILGSSIKLPNDTYLLAKNAAGSGTVNLIKANASDKAQLPDGAVTASDAAPTEDAGIANKKYIDDKLNITTGHDHDGVDSKLLTGVGAADYTKVVNTSYQAATDLFVSAWTPSELVNHTLIAYTDSNNPPTTVADSDQDNPDASSSVHVHMLVKKGDFWKITLTGTTATIRVVPYGV